MADENIITWNPTNWLTVVLMAAIAFSAFGFAAKWYKNRQGS